MSELLGDGGRERSWWVVRFRVNHEHRPRFLSKGVVAGHQSDYVEVHARALPDEPEAVDDDALRRFTAEARSGDRARASDRRREWCSLPFDQSLAAYVREARSRHIDIRSELRAIIRWTDQDARLRQLEAIRRKVDGVLA